MELCTKANNRQQIEVTKINRDISDVTLRERITNTVADVRSAYWELVYTVASVAVQEQALELAEQLVSDNRARVELGMLAPIDIEAAIRNALAQRTDVTRAERQQDINELNVGSLKNTTLPALDVVGRYQLQGQGGNLLIRGGQLGGPVEVIIPGGYSDALDQIGRADFPLWSVGLQLSYPLGTSSDQAALERARLQVRQTEVQLRQLELNVATEVTTAALQITSIQERIDSATAARELREQQLAVEESRFEVGLVTAFFVVQAQEDLAAAQETELRAILDYQLALIDFERVQRTSLGGAGISIVGG